MTPLNSLVPKQQITCRVAFVCLSSLIVFGLSRMGAGADAIGSCASLRSMARIYMASGGYEQAQPFLEKALNVARETSVPDSEASACMLDLAYLYKNQHKLTAAETMCLAGLALQQKAYQPDHPYVAHTLRILSEIYRGQGRYEEAAGTLDRAMEIVRNVSRADDQELAPFKVDMARLMVARGDLAKAECYFKDAIETIENSYGSEHFYTA
ncbi:MAG: tetratricopeptide repeat protein, partial [Sedimentisphaerales bacterium]